ncbi:hypothetical protein [Rubrimonas cliftonensis]|uniref:Uncharacterized protein n=1 Tax=Rubrimonas cliftonensis TaxID=89524 RepID=A0A1H4ARE3_9RHOB|nr:hypothetical protein [Rubrimonas cliftonensis]SEA38411.1 hypothetical protein SAMN05444370_104337 [Rubrimonas cliftonensis]
MALDLDAAALFFIAAAVCVAYLIICFVLLGGIQTTARLAQRLGRTVGRGCRGSAKARRTRPRNKIIL